MVLIVYLTSIFNLGNRVGIGELAFANLNTSGDLYHTDADFRQ